MPNSNVSHHVIFSLFIYVAAVTFSFTSCKPKVTPYINSIYVTELGIHTYLPTYLPTNQRTDRPTDRRTDRRTDRPTYIETIQHIIASCLNLSASMYLSLQHNKVANVIYQNIVPKEDCTYIKLLYIHITYRIISNCLFMRRYIQQCCIQTCFSTF